MSTTVLRPPAVVIAVLLALLWSAPALAQTRLYLLTMGGWCGGSHCPPARLFEVDVEGRRIVAHMPVSAVMPGIGPAVTPDGRFLLWSGIEFLVWDYTYSSVVLFDIARHQETVAFAGDGSSSLCRSRFIPRRCVPSCSCRSAARW